MSRILDRIDRPADLRRLSVEELKRLAQEIRDELVHVTTNQTGGHLASNLGVVELTLALHRAFDSPTDRIVWDVSHQVYVHKLITGRRDRFNTIRTLDGLSGFADRAESPHDPFGAGHAGTAISAALGMAAARDRTGAEYQVVAVVGDGALTAGMTMEALNHAGAMHTGMLVIFNDNGMSISKNVGALSTTINRVRLDPIYQSVNQAAEAILPNLPAGKRLLKTASWLKSRARAAMFAPAMFFEHFGFEYFGPVDGHDIEELCWRSTACASSWTGRAAAARPHAERPRLQTGRAGPDQAPRCLPGRRLQARCPHLLKRLRRYRDEADGAGPARGGDHGGDARGHGAGAHPQGLPGPRV
ncbi:MAG: 1-deoxy-D-xylulose-5-phosphate synthase N-terminal domain-containing protein [Dehalococcoidia bacterium]